MWNSPTVTTWMSYLAQMSGLVLILPLVLRNFSEGETALWFLFSSLIALQSLADFGFKNTFSRSIAFAMGGALDIKVIKNNEINSKKNTNWLLLKEIILTARSTYLVLAFLTFFLLATLGTLSIIKPITNVNDKTSALLAWAIIVIVSSVRFYGNVFLVYLEGTNNIPLLKRWEALTYLGGVISSFFVLLLGGKLLSLIAVNQLWVLVAIIRNKYLCSYIFEGKFNNFVGIKFNKNIFNSIWPAAWRSGVAGIMNFGMVNVSGLLYAQIGSVQKVASYLLAVRILNTIRGFSMAPFYSKLPLLAKLRAEGKITQLVKKSMKGMQLAHFVFVFGVVSVGFGGDYLLRLIGSNTKFVPLLLWALLSLAYFVQRYGAMHMQLYLTTHHVIAHIADSVSGMVFIGVSLFLLNKIDLYAFPVGMLTGYLGFYAWYSAKHSLRSINMKFWEFEKKTSLPAISLYLVFFFYVIFHNI